MFDSTWTEEVMDHRETAVAEEAFQRAEGDVAAEPDREHDGVEPWEVWKNPRIEERTDLERGRQRFTILCDDGQEVELKALVAKLNKKLGKWGQTIEIVGQEEVFKEHWLDRRGRAGAEVKPDHDVARLEKIGHRRTTIRQVKLTIESPAVAGKKTKLIGSFELAEDNVEVYRHALNGAELADIEPFLARWQDCDHCGYDRRRHSTFVCEAEDGSRVVIGRQCSRDFLGLDSAELLAREAIRKVLSNGGEEDEGPSGGGGTRYIHVESLVKKAYIVAKKLGGYSRDTSDVFKDHVAALDGAKDWGRSTHYADLRREYRDWMEKHPLPEMDYGAFADYIYGLSGDFGYNLQICFGLEWAKPKRRNLIIAGVGLFIGRAVKMDKAIAAEKAEKLPPAKHLDGAPKDRVEFLGYIERTVPFSSDYGPKTLVVIRADDGSRCVHWNTGEVNPDAEKRYLIKATIKEHKTNSKSGAPETVILRAVYQDEPKGTLI